jgi:hypothetical protein
VPHHDRKGIVEAERRQYIERESLSIFGLHAFEHRQGIAFDGILQDCRQGRAGVFGVSVNPARQQRLLADVAARQVEAPSRPKLRMRLNLLRQNLAQDRLLGKILRSDDDRVSAVNPAPTAQNCRRKRCRQKRFHRA